MSKIFGIIIILSLSFTLSTSLRFLQMDLNYKIVFVAENQEFKLSLRDKSNLKWYLANQDKLIPSEIRLVNFERSSTKPSTVRPSIFANYTFKIGKSSKPVILIFTLVNDETKEIVRTMKYELNIKS